MFKALVNNKTYEVDFSNKELSKGSLNGEDFMIDKVELEKGNFHIIRNHKSYVVRIDSVDKEKKIVVLKVNGNKYEVGLSTELDQLIASFGYEKKAKQTNELKSSMPGKVIKILIKEGDLVEENQPVLILEAMKMENLIKSPVSGQIKSIEVKEGNTINKGDCLLKF